MRELSLFTGGGGGVWASKLLGHKVVGYVEIGEYQRKIIRQRIDDGYFDNAPIFSDIRKFISEGYAESYKGLVDLLSGGFPCQPHSTAGQKKGASDERNLWPDTFRAICEIRPQFCFLENVPGMLANGYIGAVLGDLAKGGFNGRWGVFSSAGLGEENIRERLYILAHTSSIGWDETTIFAGADKKRRIKPCIQADTDGVLSGSKMRDRLWCFPDTDTERSFDGFSDWSDRLEASGNGQSPRVAATAFRILSSNLL